LFLHDVINKLLAATDPDQHLVVAQAETGQTEPPPAAIEAAAAQLRDEAVALIGGNAKLRAALLTIQERHEQILDQYNVDELVEAGFDQEATEAAQKLVHSFREFVEAKRDELAALQLIYSMPASTLQRGRLAERRERYSPLAPQRGEQKGGTEGGTKGKLTFDQLKALEDELLRTHPNWTTEALWNAYAQIKKAKRISGPRRLTNLITLIRCVVQLEDELIPFPDLVQQRYQDWLETQTAAGRRFTAEQREWLDRIAEVVGVNLAFTRRDFNDYFYGEGGLNKANALFGRAEVGRLLDELNEALV
jgi:type I restriction enzyme R subunit